MKNVICDYPLGCGTRLGYCELAEPWRCPRFVPHGWWRQFLCAVAVLLLCACTTQYVLVSPARYDTGEYYTYAAEPFERTIYHDLYESVDTVHVLSITVHDGIIEARVTESDFPIQIKYPDKLEKLEE